jgi:hypothetical protein
MERSAFPSEFSLATLPRACLCGVAAESLVLFKQEAGIPGPPLLVHDCSRCVEGAVWDAGIDLHREPLCACSSSPRTFWSIWPATQASGSLAIRMTSVPLGPGYANLGALLLELGLPYDSEDGRAYRRLSRRPWVPPRTKPPQSLLLHCRLWCRVATSGCS